MASARTTPTRLAALAALLLAGCPQLESPLTTVTGTLAGASPGAYAYPFGRADLKVPVTGGTWRIDGVPTSVGAIVLYDGARRAERVPVTLGGGRENRVDDRFGDGATVDDSLKMPLAGSVVAAAIPTGGAVPWGTAYSVIGTDLEGVVQATGAESTTLGPLPPGDFQVVARRGGFRDLQLAVVALSGASVPLGLPLPIDATATPPGCAAGTAGMACEHGLHCNPADGRCYACVTSADCGPGETCLATGLCKAASPASTVTCSACTGDTDCASGVCVNPTLAPAAGYCSTLCGSCPAGFSCSPENRCVAPDGCTDWMLTMGSTCVTDADCSELAGGICRLTPGGAAPGYCTAPCATPAQCQLGAWTAAKITCGTDGLCKPL